MSRSLRSLRPVKAAFHIVAVCRCVELESCNVHNQLHVLAAGKLCRVASWRYSYARLVAQNRPQQIVQYTSRIQRGRNRPKQAISRRQGYRPVSLCPNRMYRHTRCHGCRASITRRIRCKCGSAKTKLSLLLHACMYNTPKVGGLLYVCGSSSTADGWVAQARPKASPLALPLPNQIDVAKGSAFSLRGYAWSET